MGFPRPASLSEYMLPYIITKKIATYIFSESYFTPI